MRNAYRGEVTLVGVGTIRFTWDRIARLVDTLGSDWDAKISRATVGTDVATIAAAVAIGAGVEPAEVMRASPPIQDAIAALMEALHLAFHGSKGAKPSNGDARPTMATLFATRVKRLLRLA